MHEKEGGETMPPVHLYYVVQSFNNAGTCVYICNIKNNYTCIIHIWLGVPQCFSSISLYSSGLKLQLPLKSVTEEFNVAKV